ncbi:MAG: large subunit ribosomal protein [Fusobacteriaceae bacterium]|jgi:large subunit ribosomal protein L10|nr:ribosomal protein [Fusobacteriales bacterium]MDN5304560.1 large subunit ribosomal protein [Fusobacteriaceae bacterium]
MGMANDAKKQIVAELAEKIKASQAVIMVDYKGLSAVEADQLRKQTREAGVDYFVAKNRLFKLALKEAGVEADFEEELNGTTAFALGADPVSPAKVIYEFGKAKGDLFNIKAGLVEGKKADVATIEALAKLPSREQLLSMVLNGMLGPVRKLAYAFNAIADTKEA